MIITQGDAVEQVLTENGNQPVSAENKTEAEETAPQWVKTKPYYIVLLLYAIMMTIGLICRICG